MKVDTFFQNFELFTDAPNAIANLRELILQLAVRGKLVAQDPNDESAKILINKIKVENQEISSQKKVKKTKSLPQVREGETNFKKPQNWEWCRLGDIIHISSGSYLPSHQMADDGEIPVYGGNGVTGYHDKSNVNKPTLVIGRVGYYCGSVHITPNTAWITDNAFITYFSESNIYIRFLYWLLKATNLQVNNSATAQPVISGSKVYPLVVCVPPLAEQKRIVEKCDRLLSICDEIEKRQQQRQESIVRMNESAIAQLLSSQNPDDFRQHWQRICNNFDLLYSVPETIPKLRQAILQLAVQGKLVRQDPNDEPASVFIKRMISKRDKLIANKKINNYKPQPPIELSEISFNLPNGWECVRLGEITDIVSGVTKGRNLTGRKTTYYPYLRVANVQRGFLDLDVMKEIEIPVEELEKYRLQAGDILLTEGGDWDKLGRSAIWQGQIQDCIHQNHVFRARPLDDGLLSEWAVMYTNSPVGRQYFETAAKRTTNLASINMTQLRYCPFPLPPLAEQKRIVEKCDRLMSLCDTLEAKLKQGRDSSEKLMEVAAKQVLTA